MLNIFLVGLLTASLPCESKEIVKRQAGQYIRPVDPQTIPVSDIIHSFQHTVRDRTRVYPAITEVQQTAFDCQKTSGPGFYADQEVGCQQYQRCDGQLRRSAFLCPAGTLFNQLSLVCDFPYNVDCSQSDKYTEYSNSRLYRTSANGFYLPLLDTVGGSTASALTNPSSAKSSETFGTVNLADNRKPSGSTFHPNNIPATGDRGTGGGNSGTWPRPGGQQLGNTGNMMGQTATPIWTLPDATENFPQGTGSRGSSTGSLGVPSTSAPAGLPTNTNTVDSAAAKFNAIWDPVPTGTDSLSYEGVTSAPRPAPGSSSNNPGGSWTMSVTSPPLNVRIPQTATNGAGQNGGSPSVPPFPESGSKSPGSSAGGNQWPSATVSAGGNSNKITQTSDNTVVSVSQPTVPIHVSVVTACDKSGIVDFQADGLRDALLLSLKTPNTGMQSGMGTGSATITVKTVVDNSTNSSPASLYSLLNSNGGTAGVPMLADNAAVLQDAYFIFESGNKPVFIKFQQYNIVVQIRPEMIAMMTP